MSFKLDGTIEQSTPEPAARASVVFVCQAGPLEAKALLLAASLRAQHPSLRLIAAVPGELPLATREALAALAVEQVAIVNPLAADYPIGHKLAALAAAADDGLRVFLDSDMLCLRALELSRLAHAFAAKPADVSTFGDAASWQRLYARAGLPVPAGRVVATVGDRWMSPYFNAGLVATTQPVQLAEQWIHQAQAIDAMEDIQPKRPWLDQIALPVAVAALGWPVHSLAERWNYPAHLKPLDDSAALVHYHLPGVVRREPALLALVGSLLRRYPAVAAVVAADTQWAPVRQALQRQLTAPPPPLRRWLSPTARGAMGQGGHGDLIISGIPRSGTSFTCRSLDVYDNLAVVNEPSALFEGLLRSREPWAVPLLHAELRSAIDAGEGVPNKLDARGRLTEDTAVEEALASYRPALRDAQWVLATKNTLAYMARLDGLIRRMPQARIVLCIRHPLDTLASWKGTFAHLRDGDPSIVPVGGLADPYLPAHLREGLAEVARLPEAAWRRAGWWRLLAEEVWRWREQVVVVRYEDLVADPSRQLQRMLGPLAGDAGRPSRAFAPSQARTARRSALEHADYLAIHALCADVAERFGYDVAPPPVI